MSKKDAEEVGQWSGDGEFAGSSPSAPRTSGPLTGADASGELAPDVEPTGLDSDPVNRGDGRKPVPDSTGRLATGLIEDTEAEGVPTGGTTGPGPQGGQYREGEPAAPDAEHRGPQQRPAPGGRPDSGAATSDDGAGAGHGASATDDAGSTASPSEGETGVPPGGHQQAGAPGAPQPDEMQPREQGSSFGDVARGSDRSQNDR